MDGICIVANPVPPEVIVFLFLSQRETSHRETAGIADWFKLC